MDPVAQAIKEVSEGSMKNDQAILDLVKKLIEKVEVLESKIIALERATDNAYRPWGSNFQSRGGS
jgi:hypothetical protein